MAWAAENAADLPPVRPGQTLPLGEHVGPSEKADLLLRDVLGERQYLRMKTMGYLDLPSQRHAGRTYRLDVSGNLSYRDAGESGFNTSLCVQPQDDVPRDDQVAMRYLLVTADEERLLQVANPITFGLLSLVRALYHDFSQHHSRVASLALSLGIVGFFLAALVAEIWAVTYLLGQHPLAAIALIVVLVIPAFIGGFLVAAGVAEGLRGFFSLLRRVRGLAVSYRA